MTITLKSVLILSLQFPFIRSSKHQVSRARPSSWNLSVSCWIITLLFVIANLGTAVAADERFYGRLGASVEQVGDAIFLDVDCDSSPQVPLYGCGQGQDGQPHRSVGDFNLANGLNIGIGIRFATNFRIEFSTEWGRAPTFEGRTNFLTASQQQSVSADLWSRSAILVGFFDAPEMTLSGIRKIQPFLGAGIVASTNRIKVTRMTFPRTITIVRGASSTETGWLVTAGIAFPWGESKHLDLAWRYLDAGEVFTRAGRAHVIFKSGNRPPIDLNISPTKAKLESHALSLTIRSSF